MVKYDRLWETMKRKKISQYYIINNYGVSTSQFGRFKNNMCVSTHTLEMLCSILECSIEDIVEIIPEKIEPKKPLPKNK